MSYWGQNWLLKQPGELLVKFFLDRLITKRAISYNRLNGTYLGNI